MTSWLVLSMKKSYKRKKYDLHVKMNVELNFIMHKIFIIEAWKWCLLQQTFHPAKDMCKWSDFYFVYKKKNIKWCIWFYLCIESFCIFQICVNLQNIQRNWSYSRKSNAFVMSLSLAYITLKILNHFFRERERERRKVLKFKLINFHL